MAEQSVTENEKPLYYSKGTVLSTGMIEIPYQNQDDNIDNDDTSDHDECFDGRCKDDFHNKILQQQERNSNNNIWKYIWGEME